MLEVPYIINGIGMYVLTMHLPQEKDGAVLKHRHSTVVAKNMLKKGTDLEFIVEVTGLKKEEVLKLKEAMD